MTDFRCLPIATSAATALRGQPKDAYDNTIRRFAGEAGGLPCRHCLRESLPGEVMLLGAYDLPRPRGLYWTPSPIFVHAEACKPYARINHIPQTVAARLVSLRSYDIDHQCIYALGVVVEGSAAETPLRRALDDPRTAFVNIHTAKPGCLLCTVDRV